MKIKLDPITEYHISLSLGILGILPILSIFYHFLSGWEIGVMTFLSAFGILRVLRYNIIVVNKIPNEAQFEQEVNE